MVPADWSDASLLGDAFRLIQSNVGQRGRAELARALAHAVARRTGGTPPVIPQAERLRRDGVLPIGRPLAAEQVDESVAFLRDRPCYSGHIAAKSADAPAPFDRWPGKVPQICHALADVAAAPHLWEMALDERILAIAGSYLGCWPTIYSMNAFWSLPEQQPTLGLQTWHRDYDDFRFCTLFILLSDTTPGDGAHAFVTGSHDTGEGHQRLAAAVERYVAQHPEARGAFDHPDGLFAPGDNPHLDRLLASDHDEGVTTFGGPRGTAFIEDTYGLHRGTPPSSPRLLFWARYGLYRNVAHVNDRVRPIDARLVEGRVEMNERRRYAARLLIGR
jgi:hypothetical protein